MFRINKKSQMHTNYNGVFNHKHIIMSHTHNQLDYTHTAYEYVHSDKVWAAELRDELRDNDLVACASARDKRERFFSEIIISAVHNIKDGLHAALCDEASTGELSQKFLEPNALQSLPLLLPSLLRLRLLPSRTAAAAVLDSVPLRDPHVSTSITVRGRRWRRRHCVARACCCKGKHRRRLGEINDVRSRSRGLLGDVFIFVCIEAYQTLSPLIRARRSRGGGAAAHRNALLLDVHRIRDRVVDCAVQVEAEK